MESIILPNCLITITMLKQKKFSITKNFPGSPKKTGRIARTDSQIFCQLNEETHHASEHSILLFTPSERLFMFPCLI